MDTVSAKKGRTDDEWKLTLEDLRELSDESPAKKYINCWIKCLSGTNGKKLTLNEYASLPAPPDYKPKRCLRFLRF